MKFFLVKDVDDNVGISSCVYQITHYAYFTRSE